MLPIMIEILSTAPSRSSDPVSVAVPLTPEAEQSARAEALSAMKAMATSVFAREISAGKTPEQAHQIGIVDHFNFIASSVVRWFI
jgi:hypothetical protein